MIQINAVFDGLGGLRTVKKWVQTFVFFFHLFSWLRQDVIADNTFDILSSEVHPIIDKALPRSTKK